MFFLLWPPACRWRTSIIGLEEQCTVFVGGIMRTGLYTLSYHRQLQPRLLNNWTGEHFTFQLSADDISNRITYSTKKEAAPRWHFLCLHTLTQPSHSGITAITPSTLKNTFDLISKVFLALISSPLSCLPPPSGEKIIRHQEDTSNNDMLKVERTVRYKGLKLTLSRIISSYLYMPSLPFTCNDKSKSFCEEKGKAEKNVRTVQWSRNTHEWAQRTLENGLNTHSTYSADFPK